MNQFNKQKDTALSKDRSKKGSIDKKIKGVVEKINKLDDYFTTSSCSGRIMVIKKKGKKTDSKILFCSHEKVKDFTKIKDNLEDNGDVWLMFNPAILHICCKTIENASKIFSLARKAGFKRTGIISTKKNIIVEIIGTEFLETLLLDNRDIYYTDKSLKRHIYYANKKFDANLKKINSFEAALGKLK
ncbi:MAG: tRNA wybutosine-synthesizing 3 family protein [Nanobdellota archaeon]